MEVFICIFYIVLLSVMIGFTPRLQYKGLSPYYAVLGFLIKAGTGLLTYLFLIKTNSSTDIFRFHTVSRKLSNLFWEDPVLYSKTIALPNYIAKHFPVVYDTIGHIGFKNSPSELLLTKIQSILNILTNNSITGNIIIYSFLPFLSSLLVYRILNKECYSSKTIHWIISLGSLSILFWCNIIHKDGLTLLLMTSIVYIVLYKLNSVKNILLLTILSYLLYRVRSYGFLLLAISIFASIPVWKKETCKIMLSSVLGTGIVIITCLFANIGLSSKIIQYRHHFNSLNAGSIFEMNSQEGTFIQNILSVFQNSIMLFGPWSFDNLKYSISIVELVIIMAGSFFLILTSKKLTKWLFFGSIILVLYALFIANIVSNFGAIHRYRIIPVYFFLICAFLNKYSYSNGKNRIS